jgi:hypothetical protein
MGGRHVGGYSKNVKARAGTKAPMAGRSGISPAKAFRAMQTKFFRKPSRTNFAAVQNAIGRVMSIDPNQAAKMRAEFRQAMAGEGLKQN